MKKTAFNIPSTDGIHTLHGFVYLPDSEPKGILHVVHGMTEHIGRYDEFMSRCSEDGWLVCGYDHLGHGHTAKDDSELGFIAPKDGWKYLVSDVEAFRSAVEKSYPSRQYVLMGHSMGSFVVRLSAVMNRKPDKLIIMGTGGPNPAAGVGIALASVISAIKGKKSISMLLYALAFNGYNSRFKNDPESDVFSWTSSVKENRNMYQNDKYSGFMFTTSAMKDLVTLNKKSCEKKCIAAIDKSLPILLVSGSDDPVGSYGKGVRRVYSMMKECGLSPEMKLYDGARHELLNEYCKQEVMDDILAFMNK